MSLPPWDQLTFTFGWEPWVHTMRQCSNLTVEFSTELAPGFVANPAPAPPYTVIVYAGGYRPLTMAVGNIGPNGTFDWVVNLPLGPQYILAMKDSAGYNGGSSLLWTMSAGSGGCALDPSPITPSTLSFTRTGSAQCGEINYVMNNGTSPYQIEIIPEIHQRRTLYFATNKFGFVMDLPTGLNVYIAITDAAGNSGVDELMTIGTSNDNSCLKAAGTVSVGRVSTMYTGSGVSMPTAAITSTSSKTDRGTISSTGTPPGGNNSMGGTDNLPIILGIIVGVVAIASLISIYLCIRHRRQSRTASRTQRPANVMQQVIPYTYHGPPAPQYPSITVPQIQTPGPHAPYSENQTTTRPPNDAYTQKFTGVTTHVPRPQSYQIGQSILIDNNTSPDISPYTSRFSQGTFPGSGNILTASRLSSDTGDEKRHTTSPPLPPGALPPFPHPQGHSHPNGSHRLPGPQGTTFVRLSDLHARKLRLHSLPTRPQGKSQAQKTSN